MTSMKPSAASSLALAAGCCASASVNAAAAAAAATTAAAAVATSNLPSGSSSSYLSMVAGLLLVLALMAAIAWFMKRAGLGNHMQASAAATIIGGVSVGNRERVVVIEVGELWIVVGVAPGSVNALASMPKQASAVVNPTTAPTGFAAWLKQSMEKRHVN